MLVDIRGIEFLLVGLAQIGQVFLLIFEKDRDLLLSIFLGTPRKHFIFKVILLDRQELVNWVSRASSKQEEEGECA